LGLYSFGDAADVVILRFSNFAPDDADAKHFCGVPRRGLFAYSAKMYVQFSL
jgi:hypothetical protein